MQPILLFPHYFLILNFRINIDQTLSNKMSFLCLEMCVITETYFLFIFLSCFGTQCTQRVVINCVWCAKVVCLEDI